MIFLIIIEACHFLLTVNVSCFKTVTYSIICLEHLYYEVTLKGNLWIRQVIYNVPQRNIF